MADVLQAIFDILLHFEYNEFQTVQMTCQDAFLAGLCLGSLQHSTSQSQIRLILKEILALSLIQEQSQHEFLHSRLQIYQKYRKNDSLELLRKNSSLIKSDVNQLFHATSIIATNPLPNVKTTSMHDNLPILFRDSSVKVSGELSSHESKRLATEVENSFIGSSLPSKRKKFTNDYKKYVLQNPDSE